MQLYGCSGKTLTVIFDSSASILHHFWKYFQHCSQWNTLLKCKWNDANPLLKKCSNDSHFTLCKIQRPHKGLQGLHNLAPNMSLLSYHSFSWLTLLQTHWPPRVYSNKAGRLLLCTGLPLWLKHLNQISFRFLLNVSFSMRPTLTLFKMTTVQHSWFSFFCFIFFSQYSLLSNTLYNLFIVAIDYLCPIKCKLYNGIIFFFYWCIPNGRYTPNIY